MKSSISNKFELLAGEPFTVLCSALAGTKPLKFEWFRNNIPLQNGKYKIQSFNEANSFLNIASVDTTDAGNHTCLVSNAFGSDSISTLLSIRSKDRN